MRTERASLIEVSERKARKVRFFINADKFFKGAVIAVSGEKFRTFDRLLEHMSRIMCNQVTLPNGVRFIFALDGRVVEGVNELLHGENYVCSSTAVFKKLDYLKMTQEQEQIQQSWKGMKRDTYYLGMTYLISLITPALKILFLKITIIIKLQHFSCRDIMKRHLPFLEHLNLVLVTIYLVSEILDVSIFD